MHKTQFFMCIERQKLIMDLCLTQAYVKHEHKSEAASAPPPNKQDACTSYERVKNVL